MKVNQLITALLLSFSVSAVAQDVDFSFSPTADYQGLLNMDMYTEHIVYVFHDSDDTLDITWRLIEDTCPEDWDIQMCDWNHCYDGFPNTAEMDPVWPGGSGYLKLLVNPYNIAGSGLVHFWIYPTGAIENREDVFFHFNTTATAVENAFVPTEQLFVRSNELQLNNTTAGNFSVIDIQGRVALANACTSDQCDISITALTAGTYIFISPKGNRFTFLKP
jgi:hypothetical protein